MPPSNDVPVDDVSGVEERPQNRREWSGVLRSLVLPVVIVATIVGALFYIEQQRNGGARTAEGLGVVALPEALNATGKSVSSEIGRTPPDFVLETPCMGLASRDRKEAEQQLALFFHVFPDYRVNLDGMAAGEGVVACWGRARLSWRGAFAGLAPTGRSAELPFVSIFPGAHGMLRGERFFFDLASLCEQTGLPLEAVRGAARAREGSP